MAASRLQLRIQLSVAASLWHEFKGCAMNAKEALDDQQMRVYFRGGRQRTSRMHGVRVHDFFNV